MRGRQDSNWTEIKCAWTNARKSSFFIARISTRLRFIWFPHERMCDNFFFSTREYPRDCGLCHFCMNKREIDCIAVLRSNACEQTRDRAVFFHCENFRETKIYVISAWMNARYFFFYARISARLQIVSFPHERTWHKYFFLYAKISVRLIQQQLLRFSDFFILSPWPCTLLWPMDWYLGVGDINFSGGLSGAHRFVVVALSSHIVADVTCTNGHINSNS